MKLLVRKQVVQIILVSFFFSFGFFAIAIRIAYTFTSNQSQKNPQTETTIISPLGDGFRFEISPTPIPTVTPSPAPRPTQTPKPTPFPTSSPLPTFPAFSKDQLNHWIKHYSSLYSVSEELLKKIAVCESKFNPKAENGPYAGMYQFSSSTWKSTRGTMNLDPDPNLRFNAEEAIKTAAFKISTEGPGAWPNCAK